MDEGTLRIGQLVQYEGRAWRVGLVNECRARLDPLSGVKRTIHTPDGDKEVQQHGGSVNVSPQAMLDELVTEDLTNHEKTRRQKMAKAQVAGVPGAEAEAPMPKATATVSANRKANQDRKAQLAEKKAAAKEAKAAQPKVAKAENPCKCGCGELVAKHFAQGHDARFKGWLRKIEKGDMAPTDLPKSVYTGYKWQKRGVGHVPTLDYKGNKYEPQTELVKA